MSAFLDPLCITEVSDSIFQVCDHPFRYQSDLGGLITVPDGFKTDFASVPRVPVVYDVLGDVAHEPAVIHDYLYYSAIFSKEMADDILLEAMGVIGMPVWRQYPIYWGVKFGGFVAWNGHREAGDPQP